MTEEEKHASLKRAYKAFDVFIEYEDRLTFDDVEKVAAHVGMLAMLKELNEKETSLAIIDKTEVLYDRAMKMLKMLIARVGGHI